MADLTKNEPVLITPSVLAMWRRAVAKAKRSQSAQNDGYQQGFSDCLAELRSGRALTTPLARLTDPEVIICAAILMPDGYIIRGHRHNDCIHTRAGYARYLGQREVEQGFMTSRNRFVGRKEAYVIHSNAWTHCPIEGVRDLFSEDVY